MQQVVALFPQRLAEKFGVQTLYGRIVVRGSHRLVRVDRIERLHSRPHGRRVGADGLSAAADAAAGTRHDLDEMQVVAAGANLIEQSAGVAQAAGDRHPQLDLVDFHAGFLDALQPAHGWHDEIGKLTAGHEIVRGADIVIGAVGKPEFIKGTWIRDGAVVVDAGYHPGNVGDVELSAVVERCSAYTPVPGGVGPMTIATLISQAVTAAEGGL